MKKQPLSARIGFVHFGGVLLVLTVAAVAYVVMAPNYRDVLVTVRLAEKDMLWVDNGSPRPLSSAGITQGLKERDAFGRVTAEVVHVVSFDQPRQETQYATKKTVYVTLRLRAGYNKASGQYRYEGTLLESGDWIRLSVQSNVINGLIIKVPSAGKESLQRMTVTVQIKSEGPFAYEPFSETTGVDRVVADAITVGDTVKDSDGNVLAEILDKTVVPATRTSWDIYGNVFNRPHPRKFDVTLTVRIAVRHVGDGWFYLDSVPVKINGILPLFLSSIDIEPRITGIVQSP